MKSIPLTILVAACAWLFSVARAAESPLSVVILAGQSEMLNWHADATLLPRDNTDTAIRFYYHTGAPPLHPQFPRNFFNATSQDAWTVLRPQKQVPYHKYFETFFGPEMTLCRQLGKAGVGPLALIKIGYFGTNLAEDWRSDATTGNQLYALMDRQVTHALDILKTEGRPFRVRGIFWVQGGSDAARPDYAAAYKKNLSAFIDRMRADFAAADTPFVLTRIAPPRSEKLAVERQLVRTAQADVGSTKKNCAWVNIDDVSYDDGVHPDAHGTLAMGERLAAAWIKVQAAQETRE